MNRSTQSHMVNIMNSAQIAEQGPQNRAKPVIEADSGDVLVMTWRKRTRQAHVFHGGSNACPEGSLLRGHFDVQALKA